MTSTTTTNISTEDITDTLADMSVDGDENVPGRSISITVKRRPRYSVQINSTTCYCANVDGVVRVMKSHNRTVSTGDVFKSINIKPGHGYRLRERLNGAVVRKMPRP
jgi:hypothetical protein